MLAPREFMGDWARKDIQFIGGTENFDLWLRVDAGDGGMLSQVEIDEYPLRIHRVEGGPRNWDFFKMPLRSNTELRPNMPPSERAVTGYWGDVELSWDDVEIVEAYLRCFAPWMMGETNA